MSEGTPLSSPRSRMMMRRTKMEIRVLQVRFSFPTSFYDFGPT